MCKLHPGSDGVVRAAEVHSAGGVRMRAVQRLHYLEVLKSSPYCFDGCAGAFHMLRVLFFVSFFNANGLHADLTAVSFPVACLYFSGFWSLPPTSWTFFCSFFPCHWRIIIIAIAVPRSEPCTNCVYLLFIGSWVLYGRCSRCT